MCVLRVCGAQRSSGSGLTFRPFGSDTLSLALESRERIADIFFQSISTTLELPPTVAGAQTQSPLPFGP